jgi:hypothetical protein
MRRILPLVLLVALASCKDKADRSATSSTTETANVIRKPVIDPPKQPGEAIETVKEKMDAFKAEVAATDAIARDERKGDQMDEEWVPAEFKSGMARWKDVGVYVDGKPIAFLSWGELPITLKPVWVKDKVSAEKRPGTDDPGWRWAQQRFYRFTDYLKSLGIDPKTVNELHVYGPKFSQTNVVKRKDLLSKAAEGFMFRFGGNVSGKPIPQIPEGFGNGKTPDKIAAVMIYIKKKPPRLVWNVGLELDGVIQEGVPYYGEPIRGGIRVYLDDKLAAIIKRQELDVKMATKDASGELVWKLSDVLAAQGADTSKVVEVWAIRNERRAEKWPGAELATMTFSASSQAKGGVMLTDQKILANAIALHTRAVDPAELPVVTPDDE